ncbi:MAG: GHKL domain-containing protein [Hungatella sp.]|nr:GHKL domain-containing protein [Hungatella sp.]
MDWFSIGMDGITLVSFSILHIRFSCRLSGKPWKLWYVVLYFVLLYGILAVSFLLSLNPLFSIVGEILALGGMNRLAFKNRPEVSWTAALLAVYVTQTSFGMINSLEAVLIPVNLRGIGLYGAIVLSLLVFILVSERMSRVILRFVSMDDEAYRPYIRILILSVLFFSAAEFYIIETAYSHVPLKIEPGKQLVLLSLQALGLIALLCTLYAYERTCSDVKAQAVLSSLTQAAKAQKTYVEQARMRYENTMAFRHDIKNHVCVLEGLLQAGQTEAARAYLKKMGSQAARLSFPCQTDNPVVDILLGEKLELARLNNIAAEVSLILPKSWGVDDFDLCVMIANAMDNAIYACLAVKEKPSLCVTGESQGDFYRIQFENTCMPGPMPPVGTGLSNIKAAAEKYQGAMLTEKEGSYFRLNILLNTGGTNLS